MAVKVNDDGYVELEVFKDGEALGLFTLDLFEAVNALGEAYHAHKTPLARHRAYVKVLQELGLPQVSHKAADELYLLLLKEAGLAGNAPTGGPTPGSPASTGSTPGG